MTRARKQSPPRPIYIRPPAALRQALEARCEEERRTLTAVVVAALEAYLARGLT